jgi:hypothetical protein
LEFKQGREVNQEEKYHVYRYHAKWWHIALDELASIHMVSPPHRPKVCLISLADV